MIDVNKIPEEGLEFDEALDAGGLHLVVGEGEGEGEREEFVLQPGGRVGCRVELGDERQVHLVGQARAELGLECGRCLEPFALALDHKLDVFLLPHREDQGDEDEVELTERDMVVGYYRGHQIDLGELLREQFTLAVPMKRLCREECRGLCVKCGVNRNREACDCVQEDTDVRLAGLGGLLGRS